MYTNTACSLLDHISVLQLNTEILIYISDWTVLLLVFCCCLLLVYSVSNYSIK